MLKVGDLVTCEFGCNDRPSETCLSGYDSAAACIGNVAIVIEAHRGGSWPRRVKVQVCETGKQIPYLPEKYLRTVSTRSENASR